MHEHTLKLLIPKEKIEHRVQQLAEQISHDYQDSRLVCIGVLKGAFVFLADLLRCLSIAPMVDFIQISSYSAGTTSSGSCTIVKPIGCDLNGKDVLIVEDIIDTGTTFYYLGDHIRSMYPRSVKICTLLDKQYRRSHDVAPDYWGFVINDEFVVGYGLDCGEAYRWLPDIYALTDHGTGAADGVTGKLRSGA